MHTMASHYHALVWIDHHQAKIFHFDASGADRELVRSTNPHQHLHHKANSQDSGHAALDTPFLRQVTEALAPAGAILITGPGSAKTELSSYIQHTHPDLGKRVSGVETVDHPTEGQLVALARSFFKKDDRMHSQIPPRESSS
jgi:stalled ribosome rescue protein Dom34